MPRFTITHVYRVEAQTREEARTALDRWSASGLDAYPVQLEFESIRLDGVEELLSTRRENPWLAELKSQLLGPSVTQQPAPRKRQS